LPDKI